MSDQEKKTTPEGGNPTPQEAGERTFTTEDVNRIVQERLAKEKAKNDAALAQREAEIAQREFALYATETLKKNDLPPEIMDALDKSDKAAFENAVRIIGQYLGKPSRKGSSAGGMNPAAHYQPVRQDDDKNIRAAMGLDK